MRMPGARFEAVNQIMIDLWPMMQRCFDDLRDKKQQAQQNQQQQSSAAARLRKRFWQ